MLYKLERFVSRDLGLDPGLLGYALVLVFIATCLLVLFIFMGVNVVDIWLALSAMVNGR